MSADINSESWMTEDALARVLGVDRSIIKKRRPDAPTGCVRANGRAVEWNETGASALALALALPAPVFEKNAAPPAPVAAAEPAATIPQKTPPSLPGEELTVSSKPAFNGRHFVNPHIIKAKRANGEEVCVRVMDSGKYQPTLRTDKGETNEPMIIRAKKSVGGTWWELLSREPRWRGRF